MNSIHFVYFDVGNTLYYDENPWEKLSIELGPQSALIGRLYQKYDRKMCLGEISPRDIWQMYQNETHFRKPYTQVKEYLELYGLSPIPSMHQLACDTNAKYPIGLLTNMYANLLPLQFDRHLIPKKDLFDIIIDSSVIHMVKPDKEIFDFATKQAQVNPENILFIDNDSRHIKSAREFGWQAIQYDYDNRNQIEAQIRKLLF